MNKEKTFRVSILMKKYYKVEVEAKDREEALDMASKIVWGNNAEYDPNICGRSLDYEECAELRKN